jgi:hypothetical protein
VVLDSVYGSHLAKILTVSIQLTAILSILKEINTTKYKDLYLTRCTRKLAICHHYRHSDECIFTMQTLQQSRVSAVLENLQKNTFVCQNRKNAKNV